MVLNNFQLLNELKQAVLEERKITLKVLKLLKLVENRKLYAEKGYSSLFAFAVGFLGYSESSAGRRIASMRLLKELPEVENKIVTGELNLTSLAQAQTYFRQEAKKNEAPRPLAKTEKLELLKQLENKSSRECEKIILGKAPELISQEKRREITETKTEVKMVLNEELIQKLDRLKQLWSHKNPNMSDAELLEAMAEYCLSKVDPLRQPLPAPRVNNLNKQNSKEKIMKQRSRFIPLNIRKQIWQRDEGKCQFTDKETGKRCHSQHLLQIDHYKIPYALGGSHQPENLRLLCATHNQYSASKPMTVP